MTGRERIGNILQRKPVDRIGLFEHYWPDTVPSWIDKGKIPAGTDVYKHFGYDLNLAWVFNTVADLDFRNEVIEEDGDTILQRDGNGAVLRSHKTRTGTPEHVDFAVKNRDAWETLIKPKLSADERRINFDNYRGTRADSAKREVFFCWSGVNVFEMMHPVCGHEYMLMGMAEDPEWVRDMADTYAGLWIELMEMLIAKEGKPDGVWFYDDLGFKQRPFLSPAMYKDLIQPAHKRTIDFCHARGMPVIMHSCGFIEPLLPGLVEAGIDCLQVIEIKAGMDPVRIKRRFGDRLSLCGGMDARNLAGNGVDALRQELAEKIPVLMEGGGYILHSDHSIPHTCDYETYKLFVDEGLRLGRYR